MRYRYLILVTLAAASTIAALASGCGATESPADGTAGAGNWTQPRTAWGDADLQGVWRYESAIAFERPAELKGRELLTDEEVAQKEQQEQEEEANRLSGLEGEAVGRRSIAESPISGN
jgi:uncharacterized protein YceK